MELYEKVDTVKSREDLISLIFHLRMDLKNNKEKWENITLEDYCGYPNCFKYVRIIFN
ncbi:hypothetical protein SAMN02799633_04075 [Bacillus sp. UNCCL81]|nr:hypothetical protein SAMN02799633_04075 [Bacillus sp. UNCCL81]